MLLVAVGVHSRTLSGSEEEQLHEHLAGCEACRALTHDTEHDRPRRIARSSTETASAPDLTGLPVADPERFARGDVLARGGMGRITRARDRRLGREVALKEVLAPELRVRFEREAMITARLQHPAIVPIYEAGTWPDGPTAGRPVARRRSGPRSEPNLSPQSRPPRAETPRKAVAPGAVAYLGC